jgi:hypothetical protein
LVGKSERKTPLGTHRGRWEDNIKIDLRKVEREVTDWMLLDQYRQQWNIIVNTAMNIQAS